MRSTVLVSSIAAALLALSSSARAGVTVAVDPSADLHPISPLVYGMNFPSDQQIAGARVTVGRWGGNATTRYNYLIDTNNTGADYYFENIPGCWGAATNYCQSPPSDPKEQSSANAFLAGLAGKGVTALFTIPTIGWVAKGPPKYAHPFDCGCKSGGDQDSYDPYDTPCGDGKVAGMWIDCGPPTNTSTAVNPTFMKTWVSYLVQKFGPSNGQRIYALDNEPALWSSTHHDIRGTTRLGYDELWQRMRDHALAILDADPTAQIAGPAEWGWPNYFCSDKDDISKGCFSSSPDRAAHGGEELMAWLLDQARAYEQQNGRRILHYLDLHYYPQGGNPPDITRSLWDKTYTDPSWIGDKIYLVPRMRDWVDQHYPGTKLAVSEYDFYSHDQPVGAVTYAEVLGIFGREGLDMATAWSPPAPTDAAFAAYKLYRNADGQGAGFESTSVRATVTGNGVQAYAAASANRLTVVLVNEQGGADVSVTLGNFEIGGGAQAFQHTGSGSDVTALGAVAAQGGAIPMTLPGTSITLLVVDGQNPNMLPDAGGTTSASSGSATTTSSTTGSGSSGSAGGAGGAAGSGGAGGDGGSGGNGGSGGKGAGGGKSGCSFHAVGGDGTGGASAAALILALAAGRRRRRGGPTHRA